MALLKFTALLFLPLLAHCQEKCEADVCQYENYRILMDTTKDGATDHYFIGGLFGVHERGDSAYSCGEIRERGILNAEAFFWAIKKYSVDTDAVEVGGVAFDSCSRGSKNVENVYSTETCRTNPGGNVEPRNLLAYVGPDRSSEAIGMAMLLQDMNKTLVSHAATSPALNGGMYEYFLRTVPSDEVDTEVLAELLELKGVKYVQVVYMANAYGIGAKEEFESKLQNEKNKKNICIVGTEMIPMDPTPDDFDTLVGNLYSRDETKHVLLFADKDTARQVLEAVNREGYNGRFIFLGTSSWGDSLDVIEGLTSGENAITVALRQPDLGYQTDVTDFWKDFFEKKPTDTDASPWFVSFWEQEFKCSVSSGTCDVANQDLSTRISRDVYVPYTLMAVDAIIRGVKAAAETWCNGNYNLCSELLNAPDRGQKLFGKISAGADKNNFNFFKTNSTNVNDHYATYKVLQVQGGQYKHTYNYIHTNRPKFEAVSSESLFVGTSQCPSTPCSECNEQTTAPVMTTTTTTPKSEVTTTDKTQGGELVPLLFSKDQHFTGMWIDQPREDSTYGTRFKRGQDWIIALGVLAGLGILCVLVFEIYILYKLLGTRIGKQWRTMWLGQLLLFGLFLCFLTLFAYIFIPTDATCGITRFGVGVSYAICFGVLLVKLMVLLTSKSTDSLIPGDVDSPNYLRGIYQFLMFIFVVGVQVVIAVQWLIQVPPRAIQVTSNTDELVWICNHYTWEAQAGYKNMTTFVRNEFENHLLSLTYIMFLIAITTIVAMKAHGIITNHRESVFIGIAGGFSIPIWIAWGLVGGLNKDHDYAHEFGDACLAFGLFLTATLIMFAMFLPKVRQLVNMGVEGIYLEDDRDTYYAGSVIMAPPSYKSRPSSVVYVNSNGLYSDPVVIGDQQNALHMRHPGSTSTYSAPVYVKRPESQIGGSGKVLRVTGDLTGKNMMDKRKPASEMNYYTGGTLSSRKARSDAGGTMKRATSAADLGAL